MRQFDAFISNYTNWSRCEDVKQISVSMDGGSLLESIGPLWRRRI